MPLFCPDCRARGIEGDPKWSYNPQHSGEGDSTESETAPPLHSHEMNHNDYWLFLRRLGIARD